MTEKELSLIDRWKQKADELRLQLNLGSKELEDTFEEQKEEIGKWARDTRARLTKESSVRATDLRIRLEELEVQAALGRAETRDALQEQRKKFSKLIENARKEAQHVAENTESEVKGIAELADHQLDIWQTRFDILKLQLSLGAAEASDEWKESKAAISKRIKELESRLDKAKAEGENNWNHFKSEMAEAWRHVKSAFS